MLRMHQTEKHFPLAHPRKRGPASVGSDRLTTCLQHVKVRSEPAATHSDGTKKMIIVRDNDGINLISKNKTALIPKAMDLKEYGECYYAVICSWASHQIDDSCC